MRLEHYLRQEVQLTRAQIKSIKFTDNGLRVNGKRARVSETLHRDDVLEILLEQEKAASGHLEMTEEPLCILYEDEDLIAVWKEAGLVIHPSCGHYADTLSNRLHAYFAKRGKSVVIRSIGRLDRDTSGIVVFAKNKIAAARLWKQKENGIFWKEYLAVCEGMLPSEDGVISSPIGKVPGALMKMCVTDSGQPAVTHYQVIRRMKEQNQSVLRVRIETGRTHQIRVHMASIGYPLVGDVIYGSRTGSGAEESGAGLRLCAWKAEFEQPFTGERIHLEGDLADLPEETGFRY